MRACLLSKRADYFTEQACTLTCTEVGILSTNCLMPLYSTWPVPSRMMRKPASPSNSQHTLWINHRLSKATSDTWRQTTIRAQWRCVTTNAPNKNAVQTLTNVKVLCVTVVQTAKQDV